MPFFDKISLRMVAAALYIVLAVSNLFDGTGSLWQRVGSVIFLTLLMGSAYYAGAESTEKDLIALNERITKLEDSVEEKA